MDIFFNELSLSIAADNNEACRWLENLARVGQLLKRITESVQEDAFAFRRNDDFAEQMITETQTVAQFLQNNFGYDNPVCIFLLGIFDSPYITEKDPQKTEYDLTSITFAGVTYDHPTGIAAAYLKDSLVVSLNSDIQWDVSQLNVLINRLNHQANIITDAKSIKHASKNQHVIGCHLQFFANLYDWSTYKPRFDPVSKAQTLLNLVEIYTLALGERTELAWEMFYQKLPKLAPDQRVSRVLETAAHIAKIQKWNPATGSLKKSNPKRKIYTIPSSAFIVSVDTQHGEFEIHMNQKGNNHLGAVSFDGKRFKRRKASRSLGL